jgi:hypothetical protein
MKTEHFGKRVWNLEDIIQARDKKKSLIGEGYLFTKRGNYKDESLSFSERMRATGTKQLPAAVIINMNACCVHYMLKNGLYIYITKKELKENG